MYEYFVRTNYSLLLGTDTLVHRSYSYICKSIHVFDFLGVHFGNNWPLGLQGGSQLTPGNTEIRVQDSELLEALRARNAYRSLVIILRRTRGQQRRW